MPPSKRDEIVQKAMETFYRNGFHATGMDMLVAESGISKTSMYKHFRTKDDLIVAALKLREEQFNDWAFQRIDELASDPRNKLLAFFDVLEEWFQQDSFKSCMFIKASSEYPESDHPIHRQTVEQRTILLSNILHLVRLAHLKEPEQLARQIVMLQEGAIVTAHFGNCANPAADAKHAANALIEAAS
ncbi:TetR family transcriptional regulator [Pseudovibrio sp. Tun.PSC04-5.I4]|uniref:TetR/AcrR family transcriptional regulator n=1 Tax=Pseudovibrio sp. Tun.PSC04-5.I4 TaxID=1798213 RepID=UPI000885D6C0|nr:TetR family transcriptional regulator [Pseudovibrio sp. Tun.PSC04-5.I4]SDQ19427.1 regulatory protein, tetR family [Pseudovibrio sp. Tun.PSC04-5.I4]